MPGKTPMTFFVGTCLSGRNDRTRTVDQPARSAESYRIVLEPLMYSAVTRNIEVQAVLPGDYGESTIGKAVFTISP